MAAFGVALPAIRRQVEHDLGLPGLPRRKVLAAIVQLLQGTLIRVGNEEYARSNESFGLTTLQDDHAQIRGSEMRFTFRGKSSKEHSIGLRDRRLARVVKQCRDIPGQRLFQYAGADGQYHNVYSEDVNDYLRAISGQDFTAKDFRTWYGTVLAVDALRRLGPFSSQSEAKRNVLQGIDLVSACLGNTRAICRRCYVHPAVVEAYLDGSMLDSMEELERQERSTDGLSAQEDVVLRFLQRLPARTNGQRSGLGRGHRAVLAGRNLRKAVFLCS